MKRCPNCGKEYPDEANFCPLDAGRLAPVADAPPGPAAQVQSAAVAPARAAGENVVGGRFYLGTVVGGGVTGQVYEAVDRSEGQKCAVKLVNPTVFPSSLQLQRTERELKQLERVDAQGVARVIEHGRHGQQLWIATELVQGQPLDQVVASQGPMPPERAAAVIVKIGEALAAAARVGVIHRDMSPKNVLVNGSDVKLINFGVPAPGVGKVQGVPEYVSPEQIEGRPVDQRSNIYSLGALLYVALTGRPPYSGSPEEVHQQHLGGTFSSPGGHMALPPALDPVVVRAMERVSSRRYMTLRQFLDDVRRAAAAAGTAGAVATTTQPMGRPGAKQKDKKLAKTMLGAFALQDDGRATDKMASAPEEQAPETEKMASPAPAELAPRSMPPAAAAGGNLAPPMEPRQPEPAWQQPAPAEPAWQQPAPAEPAWQQPAPAEPAWQQPAPAEPAWQQAAPAPAQPAAAAPAASGGGAVAGGAATPVGQPWHEQVQENVAGNVAKIAERAGVHAGAVAPGQGMPDSPMLAKRSEGRDAPQSGKQGESAGKGGKGRFRETLWFKKGALDAEVAQQAAMTDAKRAGLPVADKADEMPIEDRYEDDGSIDARDKQAFSLQTGHTQTMRAMGDVPAPSGDGGVSEDDLISEMKGGRGKIILALVAALVLIAALVAYFALRGGDDNGKKGDEEAPAAESAPSTNK